MDQKARIFGLLRILCQNVTDQACGPLDAFCSHPCIHPVQKGALCACGWIPQPPSPISVHSLLQIAALTTPESRGAFMLP